MPALFFHNLQSGHCPGNKNKVVTIRGGTIMLAHVNKATRNDISQVVGSLALILLIVGTLLLIRSREPVPPPDASPAPELGAMPLAFEPNAGQTDQMVRFLAHGGGGLLFFA